VHIPRQLFTSTETQGPRFRQVSEFTGAGIAGAAETEGEEDGVDQAAWNEATVMHFSR
jgi:hypothetical protein